MRYFYISYSVQGGMGACTMTTTRFINHKEFKERIKERQPNIVDPFIISWKELTEEEYLVFNED